MHLHKTQSLLQAYNLQSMWYQPLSRFQSPGPNAHSLTQDHPPVSQLIQAAAETSLPELLLLLFQHLQPQTSQQGRQAWH